MRANQGNRHVRTWRKSASILAGSLLALSVLGGTVQAAAPKWPVGHGTDYLADPAPESGASSSSVTAGKTVGFFEWLRNPGPNNISQLYLNVTTDPVASVVGAAWTIEDNAGTVVGQGTCVSTAAALCSFGALNAGQTVYVTAAFTTSGALADGTKQNVRFEFNSTGIPPGGNKSHGDVVPLPDFVGIDKNGDARGDFNFNGPAGITVQNDPVGGTNTQSTFLTVGGTQVGAAVDDSPSLPAAKAAKCTNALIADIVAENSWFSCKKLTTLTSFLEVGNGKTFTNVNGGPAIQVTISFAQAPNQLNGAHPFAYHYFVDASGEHAELITALCNYVGGFPDGATPSEGCLDIDGTSVTVWVFHNGGMRN
jgi:hypothetical protein